MSEQLAAFGLTLQQVVASNGEIVETLAELISSQQSLIAGQAGIMDQLLMVNRTLVEMISTPDDGLAETLRQFLARADKLMTEVERMPDEIATKVLEVAHGIGPPHGC